MKMPNVAGLFTVGKAIVSAHRPEILFGTSVVTTVAAVVAAARGGYKSGQQVLEAEMALAASPEPPFDTFQDYYATLKEQGPKLSNKEKAQLTWLNYLPAAGLTVGSIGATTGLHIVHVKEKKQLAAVALLAIDEVKKEAKKYEDALHEVGMTIKDDPASLEAAADEKGVAKVLNTDGEIDERYLIRDGKTQRTIWSNKRLIDEAVIECNEQLSPGGEGDCELNFFYTQAGFANIPDGGDLGWSGEKLSLSWKNTVLDDGRPVREFAFRPAPRPSLDRSGRKS